LLRLFRLVRLVFHLRLSFLGQLGQLGITECMRERERERARTGRVYQFHTLTENKRGGEGRVFREAAQIEK